MACTMLDTLNRLVWLAHRACRGVESKNGKVARCQIEKSFKCQIKDFIFDLEGKGNIFSLLSSSVI